MILTATGVGSLFMLNHLCFCAQRAALKDF